MNTINITPAQIWSVTEGASSFIPVTVNGNNYVLNIEVDEVPESKVEKLFAEIRFSINVKGAKIADHLGMNIPFARYIGVTSAAEFLHNLAPESEIDKNLYK